MSRTHLVVLAALLTTAGLGIFFYKVLVLGFPLAADEESRVWTVQARFAVDARRGPIKVVLQVPHQPPGFTVLDEDFVSRGFGLTTRSDAEGREAEWTIRQARGRQTFYYRALVAADGGGGSERGPRPPEPDAPELEEPYRTAMAALVAEAERRSADVESFTAELLRLLADPSPRQDVELFLADGHAAADRARVAVTLLAGAGVPARVVYGVRLEERQRHAAFVPWLEVHDGRRWLGFDPASGRAGLPDNLLIWWRGERRPIEVAGASNPELEVSVQSSTIASIQLAERRGELGRSPLVEFSLVGLPIQTQTVYAVALLVPIGAFLMVLLRNVIGIKTFGTFMPILVALAFRETRLVAGVLLFTGVVALGLGLRFYLERLHLLLVPRLAAVLSLVVLVMAAISVFSHKLGIETGLSVALFPLVIITMAIERLSIVWEERGPVEAMQEGLGSLLVAAVAYLVMIQDAVEHLVFVFPELLLVVLAATLLLGRYRGYRLLELTRFRALTEGPP